MNPSFSGRCVVITGAASGIGEALAQDFAARGARLLLALSEAQSRSGTAHLVLTGGSMGSAILAGAGASGLLGLVDDLPHRIGQIGDGGDRVGNRCNACVIQRQPVEHCT